MSEITVGTIGFPVPGAHVGHGYSDYIISNLKLSRMVILGHRMLRSVAGYSDDKLFVVIPHGIESPSRVCDPMPEIPAWLREVKESEFLAAQGK